jgi:hypothetical protein
MATLSTKDRPRLGKRSVATLTIVYALTAIVLWRFLPPRPRFQLGSDGKQYRYPVFSPDGSLLAASYCRPGPTRVDETGDVIPPDPRTLRDLAVELLNVADGRLVAEWKIDGSLDQLTPLQFSPDGRWLAATLPNQALGGEQTIIWDVASGRPVTTVRLEEVTRYGWGVTNKIPATILAAGGRVARTGEGPWDRPDVVVWDEAHRREVVLPGSSWPCTFSADGGTIVAAASRICLNSETQDSLGFFLIAVGGGMTLPWTAAGAIPLAETARSLSWRGTGPASNIQWTYHVHTPPRAPGFYRAAVRELRVCDAASGKQLAAWPLPTVRWFIYDKGALTYRGNPIGTQAVGFTFASDRKSIAAVLRSDRDSGGQTFVSELNLASGVWSDPIPVFNYSPDYASIVFLAGARRLLVNWNNAAAGPASFLVDLDAKVSKHLCAFETATVRPDGRTLAYQNPDRFRGNLFELMAGVPPPATPPPSAVKLHDVATDEVRDLCSVAADIGTVVPLAFSADGRAVAVRYFGGQGWLSVWNQAIHGRTGIRIYDTVSQRFAWTPGTGAAFAGDGRTLAVFDDAGIRLYDLPLRAPWFAIAGWAMLPTGLLWLVGRWRAARRHKRAAALAVPAS